MFKGARKFNKSLVWFSVSLVFLFSFCLVTPAKAGSASLFLAPASGTYAVGSSFSVAVKVNSGGVTINAAEGELNFDPNQLNVVSVSKNNSIFNLWTTEPNFSNSNGKIVFGGGTPSAFDGTSGTIITITFRGKTAGLANVNFSSGMVLAADGQGTNVLSIMKGGSYNIQPTVITPPAEEAIPLKAPAAPVVSSPTHPDPEKWYSNNDPEFTFELATNVTGVSLSLDKKEISDPGPISDGLMESKKYEDVEDGIWYFHIKFRNKYGWGKISHRRILVDIISPKSFEIEIKRENPTDPQPVLLFQSTDETSGISHYEIKIGEGDVFPVSVEEIKANPYKMPFQAPGSHPTIIKAMDRAGNFTSAFKEVIIEPKAAPPEICLQGFKIFGIFVSYLIAMIILLVIIGILILLIIYQWYRFSIERKRLRRETREAEENLRRAFRALREEVQEQIEHLDKKPGLSKNEKEIRNKLQEALNISEEFIGKEIKDIEKELE